MSDSALIFLLPLLVLALAGVATNAFYSTRRRRALLLSLGDAARSAPVVQGDSSTLDQWTHVGSFVADLHPAPDPFIVFTLACRAPVTLNPLGLLARWLLRRGGTLRITARLPRRPSAELVWARGRTAGVALGRDEAASLWVQRRLDTTGSEYATRGPNPQAIVRAFQDLHARFGPLLDRVLVQGRRDPKGNLLDIEVTLHIGSLNASELPALVATLRALGRAALR